MSLVDEVKRKREFSGLPDSVVERALVGSKNDVKDARALLRKYFGVFLTNRVLKGKGDLLKVHISSKKRDYGEFFSVVGDVESVIDLGCGVNGFSYKYLPDSVSYIGVEAAGQLVELINDFFEREGFDGKVVHSDLFDVGRVVELLRGMKKPRVVFMFQLVDALEILERDFSKKFILEIAKECEWIVLTLPTESLGGRKKFMVYRKWMLDFLGENFLIEKKLESRGEKIIILKNKK